CTMQGDVWRFDGMNTAGSPVNWRRVASGLHQPLGMIVHEDVPYVLGRDQITRLYDLNSDGEYDFHECFSNAFKTSPGGHDFICGLVRKKDGSFCFASSNQGVVQVSADGKKADVLATGFRNPDGIGLSADEKLTVPCSEGDWTPSSMICQIQNGGFYGYGGPRNKMPPELPLVYLPRGIDNSSGGQITVSSDQWGPLKDLMVHFSFGACSHML
ncbi:MAG: heme-binding domain-containing protein, partial [Planctomycetia bacterium]